MKTISIVRSRGQLTIPDSLRKQISWVTPLSAVSMTIVKPDEIIIRPWQPHINWELIRQNIRASRATSGRDNPSAAEFLEQDRHRR